MIAYRQKRRRAAAIMCALILAGLLLGAYTSGRRLYSGVEKLFYNGAKGDGIGIASDLSGRVSAAQGLVTVAKRYLEASDRLIVNVEEAGSALSTASSLRKAKEADDRLSIAALELFDALGELGLSDKDAGYRSSLYADFTSYASTMSHDPYNEAAVTYNENIRAFPGRLFFSLMGYRSAPVFR